MIINNDREPKYSLIYIGSVLLEHLNSNKGSSINDLYMLIKNIIDKNIHIDFLYYTLDWLFILDKIKLEGDRIIKC